MEVKDRVIDIVSKQLGVQTFDVKEEYDLQKDLGADSIDIVEICMELQEDFGLVIAHMEMDSVNTVGDLIQLIDKKRKGF